MELQAHSVYKYQVAFSNGRQTWLADEPKNVGGTDLGPTPVDLLMSAVAGCKIITVQMYAERKGWPLDGIALDITHERVKASECDECDSENGLVTIINSIITLMGELTIEQKTRLIEIAGKCPVHRMLTNEVIIKTGESAS